MRRFASAPGWPSRFHLIGGSEHFFRDLAHCIAAACSVRRLR